MSFCLFSLVTCEKPLGKGEGQTAGEIKGVKPELWIPIENNTGSEIFSVCPEEGVPSAAES